MTVSLTFFPLELDCECVVSTMFEITSLRFVFHFFCTRCCFIHIEVEKFCRILSAAPCRLLIIAYRTLCGSTFVPTSAACPHSLSVVKTSGSTIAAPPWRGYFRSASEIVEKSRLLSFRQFQPPQLSSFVFPSYYIPHTERQLAADHRRDDVAFRAIPNDREHSSLCCQVTTTRAG
jgi:hypothetical protein